MIQRCHNPKSPKFHHYGGRGIVVCDRWHESFDAFLADVGPKPSPKHSIDRYPDPNGNYEPGNVRWATQTDQMRNTRRTRRITVDGVSAPLQAVAEERGLIAETLRKRLERGMTDDEVLGTPIRPKERFITFNGVTRNAIEWSRALGGEDSLVASRIHNGWSETEAVSTPAGASTWLHRGPCDLPRDTAGRFRKGAQ